MFYVLCIIAGVLGTMRYLGIVHPSYQAAAHFYVGSMFAAAFIHWRLLGFKSSLKYGLLALALSALEVYCALASRKLI